MLGLSVKIVLALVAKLGTSRSEIILTFTQQVSVMLIV
jgi:hypothetical protein